MAHEEAFFVVVGVDGPATDNAFAVAAAFAGIENQLGEKWMFHGARSHGLRCDRFYWLSLLP